LRKGAKNEEKAIFHIGVRRDFTHGLRQEVLAAGRRKPTAASA
jgi:hypothetical protein